MADGLAERLHEHVASAAALRRPRQTFSVFTALLVVYDAPRQLEQLRGGLAGILKTRFRHERGRVGRLVAALA